MNMNENNIILIGMPASGKSTIGVILAKFHRCDFIDTDLVIQRQTGHALHELLEMHGFDGFCSIENDVCKKVEADNTVIATGGSVIYGREAMEHFKKMGKVVYLRTPINELRKRLGDLEQRGVALKDGMTFEDLYNERVPLYERYADVTVEEAGRHTEDVVREIIEALKL